MRIRDAAKFFKSSKSFWETTKGTILLINGLVLGKLYSLIAGQASTSFEAIIMVFVCLAIFMTCVIFVMNINVLTSVGNLDSRHRLKVRFISAAGGQSQDVLHEKAKQFLEHCDVRNGCTIIAVNSYLEASSIKQSDSLVNEYATDYYQKIEELVSEGAEYSRIVQLPEGVSFAELIERTRGHYRDHFARTMAMQKVAKRAVLLMSAKARFPLSFLLMKNQNGTNYLIWQIDEQTSGDAANPPQFQLHGIFLIEDPDRLIIGHFEWCFNQLLHAHALIEPAELSSGTA